MSGGSEDHQRVVMDQFTRQADQFREFAEMPGQPRDMVLAATQIDAGDTVLDVACGPGVTTWFYCSNGDHGRTGLFGSRTVSYNPPRQIGVGFNCDF